MLPSIFKSKITRTVSAIVVVLAIVALSGCSKKVTSTEPQTVWDTYVSAMHSGDAGAAKACFATESQPFVLVTKKEMDWFNNCQFKLVSNEQTDKYTKLEFEQTVSGKPYPRTEYFVRQGDKVLMQYPYILFASDWPVVATSHFRFHLDPASVFPDGKENNYSATIDTVPFEQYISLLDSLTGIPIQRPIDYYYSPDTTTIAKPLGAAKVHRGNLGRMVGSVMQFDFRNIAKIPLAQDQERIPFVIDCVLANADLEWSRADTHSQDKLGMGSVTSKHIQALTLKQFEAQIASGIGHSDHVHSQTVGYTWLACSIF